MTKQKRRIVLFILASLAILGLVFGSAGRVSARRGSPNCWGDKKEAKSGQAYRDYIKEIRGTDHYEFIPCPGCGKQESKPAKKKNNRNRDKDRDRDPDPPAPPVCSPRYHGPTISLTGYTPDYPLVIGQDPDDLGVDVTLRARGGSKSNGCNRGAGRATITSFSLNGVNLSDEAIARIQGELARAYPDAQVLDSYPLHPGTTYGGNGTSTTLAFHFDPLDPGDYDITVTARQSDGKQTTRTFQVPVHLLETTLGW